jgi:hypothetical protein
VRAGRKEPVAQVPPEFAFRFGRSRAHRTGEAALPRHDRSIAFSPDSRLVFCGHVVALFTATPTPNPTPQGGGEPHRVCRLKAFHFNAPAATTGRGFGALDSRQQQLGGFVALARESAQLTTT